MLTERTQVFQLIQDIAEHINASLEPIASFQHEVDAVVAAAAQTLAGSIIANVTDKPAVSDDEIGVLRFLASIPDDETAEHIASAINRSGQKTKFFLEELASKDMVHISPMVYGIVTYSITQAGRRVLIQKSLL